MPRLSGSAAQEDAEFSSLSRLSRSTACILAPMKSGSPGKLGHWKHSLPKYFSITLREAALAIAAHLGVAPEAILYVGDSAVDMQTARGAGMDAVGVLWGFRTAGELRAAGAHHLIAQPKELLPLVFSSAAPPSR